MENKDINTNPVSASNVRFRVSKAFIGYVIISLVIIVSATMLLIRNNNIDNIGVDMAGIDSSQSNQSSTTTASGSENSNNNGVTTGGGNGNDMNGSGQNEPSRPIQFTGYQSPIIVPMYQGHIVGGDQLAQKVRIDVRSVLEDSRCPQDVQCIQAGRVRIGVRFSNPETKALIIDGQTMEEDSKVKVNGLEITLLEAKSNTKAGIKIKDQDYKFIFGITKSVN